ncbi:MAG: hypothetical protein KBG11_05195 [Bacteroidia bacterium]|nr:hypothetical protein [Bacteroidia bacterium]
MKTPFKLVAIALVMLFSTATFAQGQKKHGQKMNKDSAFAKISTRLQLTTDQQTKLKEIRKQNQTEIKAVREANKTASKEDKRKAIVAQFQKNDSRIKQVLNETQKVEYDKIKAEKKAEMKKRRAENKQNGNKKGKKRAPAEIKPDNLPNEIDEEDVLDDGIL